MFIYIGYTTACMYVCPALRLRLIYQSGSIFDFIMLQNTWRVLSLEIFSLEHECDNSMN